MSDDTVSDDTVICGECGNVNIIPANLREVMKQRDVALQELAVANKEIERLRRDVNKIAEAVRQFAVDIVRR